MSRLVFAGVGGAPTPDAILHTWQAQGAMLQQGYGMTETSPLVLVLDKEDAVRKAGSAGKPVLNMEMRVVAEDGTDAPPGTIGELWVKGPEHHQGLLAETRSHRRRLHRWLAAHRRRRAGR